MDNTAVITREQEFWAAVEAARTAPTEAERKQALQRAVETAQPWVEAISRRHQPGMLRVQLDSKLGREDILQEAWLAATKATAEIVADEQRFASALDAAKRLVNRSRELLRQATWPSREAPARSTIQAREARGVADPWHDAIRRASLIDPETGRMRELADDSQLDGSSKEALLPAVLARLGLPEDADGDDIRAFLASPGARRRLDALAKEAGRGPDAWLAAEHRWQQRSHERIDDTPVHGEQGAFDFDDDAADDDALVSALPARRATRRQAAQAVQVSLFGLEADVRESARRARAHQETGPALSL